MTRMSSEVANISLKSSERVSCSAIRGHGFISAGLSEMRAGTIVLDKNILCGGLFSWTGRKPSHPAISDTIGKSQVELTEILQDAVC